MKKEALVINKNIVDLRKKPRFRSERVSQALFNTLCEIEDSSQDGQWLEVQTPDGYRGWVEARHLSKFSLIENRPEWKVSSDFAPVKSAYKNELITRFVFDTRFRAVEEGGDLILEMPQGTLAKVSRRHCKPAVPEPKDRIGELAKRFIGVPYLWGGVSPFGFDCSGFVQRLFHYCGVQIPRDTAQQIVVGQKIDSLEELKLGDLVFFPRHVALYLGEGLIIHSCLYFHGVTISNLYHKDDYSLYLREHFLWGRRVL